MYISGLALKIIRPLKSDFSLIYVHLKLLLQYPVLLFLKTLENNMAGISEMKANIVSVGGGILIFMITAVIMVFMTIEYNKGKEFEILQNIVNGI